MDTSGYKHIKLIVKKAMALCDAPNNKYDKVFELAIDCYRDLRLYHVQEGLEIVKLSVGSLSEVDFPDDMLKYVGICIVVNGEFVRLTRRDAINPTTSELNGSEYYDSDIGEGEDVLDRFWDGFTTRGGLNKDGYYYVDYPNKRFILRNTTVTQVWLLYISSGVHLDSETYVPVTYEPVFYAYIIYWSKRFMDNVPLSRINELKNQYDNELIKLRNSQIPTIYELEDILDNLTYNGVRR